jgi:hypothetical protein
MSSYILQNKQKIVLELNHWPQYMHYHSTTMSPYSTRFFIIYILCVTYLSHEWENDVTKQINWIQIGAIQQTPLCWHEKGVGYDMAWKWIRISLESRMVSWYKNEIIRAGVSNCMRQCLNFLLLNVHIPAYMGSRGKPFFLNFEVFLLCLSYNNWYCMNLHTLI